MYSEKAFEWTKAQCSKPRPGQDIQRRLYLKRLFFSSLWQTVSDMCSENDKIIVLSHFRKVHANEGHLEIAF